MPTPRTAAYDGNPSVPAVAHQRLLHQAVRREFRMLAELTGWAPADDTRRTKELTRHADLAVRIVLQHHAIERELLWPALFGSLPATEQDAARELIADWTRRIGQLDRMLRGLGTAARQWAVVGTRPARDAFLRACDRRADALDAHTATEEVEFLPVLDSHLLPGEWRNVRRAVHSPFDGREQMLVLGLVLEDACATDRARVLAGLSPVARTAWRLFGRRTFHAAVVRLRGAPPAA